ncbi:MAG: hypothetical protein M1837_007522 [Sclerophora amabilis]|nr:MAG: hypothetical protein M1837_007522 [Sclerophora amabilis]
MKFSTAMALYGMIALSSAIAAPQGGDPGDAVEDCLEKCDAADVNCKASCASVPFPNEDDVHETNDCSEKCEQGDGSPSETEEYGRCLARCVSSHYLTSGSGSGSTAAGAATRVASSLAGSASSALAGATDSASSAIAGATKSASSILAGATSSAGAASSAAEGAASSATAAAGTATESAAASETTGAASNVQVGSVAGMAGLLAAIFAL